MNKIGETKIHFQKNKDETFWKTKVIWRNQKEMLKNATKKKPE